MGSSARYFLREVAQSFKRNVLLNFSSISTVMVLIFQLGFFILIVANINYLTSIVMGKLQVTAILSPQLSLEKAGQLKARIMKNPKVTSVHYVSKTQAFQRLKSNLSGKVDLNNLTRNPLPDTLVIELSDASSLKEIAEEVGKYPGIDSVRYGDAKLIDKLIRLSGRIYLIGVIIIGMLLISAVFLIANTIRLTVFSRRKEIAIMELVGAAHWFIRGPFIVEGLIHGLMGSGIAILLLNLLYNSGAEWILEDMPFLPVIPPGAISLDVSLSLLVVGILVGGLSSYFSVSKYLKI